MNRPWYDDGPQKAKLLERITDGLYIQFSNQGTTRKQVGQVVRTIYAGYKVKVPTDEEVIINPQKDQIIHEFSNVGEYNIAVEAWKAEEAVIREEARLKRQALEDARQAILKKQADCLHENVDRVEVLCVAGCDINDVICTHCGKRLERSWSTAYENDPNSLISDWNWFLRYCHKTYNGYVPKQENYDIVPEITEEIRRY
jgi:hypothetical protein